MSTHIALQDPSSMSARFGNDRRLGYDADNDPDLHDLILDRLHPKEEEELVPEGQSLNFSEIERFLPRIPSREADLIRLYYHNKMKQEQIAKIFSITQAAVSYRLHRGIKRIQFLCTIPELEKDVFDLELGPKFNDQDREILWRMYETTCQSEIAKQMRLTQGRVRHRFFRALQKINQLIAEEAREKQVQAQVLKKQGKSKDEVEAAELEVEQAIDNSRFGKYWTVFFAISDKHFNILHEVSLPQFKDRGDAQIITIE
jgi:DNA-directed RNA polymerase specialized sigma24 family protein